MATIVTINRSSVRETLLGESTNAARTLVRNDGASEFEQVAIDEQVDLSLDGAWREACSKLVEKMHEFLYGSSVINTMLTLTLSSVPDGLTDNIKMYIVDYMMQDWLASVRPDYRQRYIDRANMEMDDLLRKLYKKEPPV